jgi:AraC-like DNA-binding protein
VSRQPPCVLEHLYETHIGPFGQDVLIDRSLTINEVSEVLDISVRTLQRRLAVEDTTYSDALQRTRSEMAGELLEKTDQTIAEIAVRLGFSNSGNMTRAFKQWSGVSPRVYRQQQHAG